MKKILIALVVVLLGAAGYIFYQRQQATAPLEQVLKGKTYQFTGGLELIVPPSNGSVEGFLKPKVKLPSVTLKVGTFGSVDFKNVDVSRAVDGSTIFEVPSVYSPAALADLKIDHPRFEVDTHDQLKLMGAKSIAYQDAKKPTAGELSIGAPMLKAAPSPDGGLPKSFVFEISNVLFNDKLSSGSNSLKLGSIRYGYETNPQNDRLQAKIFFEGQGGSMEEVREGKASGTLKIGEWKLQGDGSFKKLNSEELKVLSQAYETFIKSYVEMLQSMVFMNMNAGLSPPAGQQTLSASLTQLEQSLQKLDILPGTSTFSWKGLEYEDANKNEKLLISPILIESRTEVAANGIKSNSSGKLDEIRYQKGDAKLVAFKNLQLKSNVEYQINYSQMLSMIIKQYGRQMEMMLGLQGPERNIEAMSQMMMSSVLGAFAAYPDQGDAEISVESLQIKDATSDHQQKNASLKFFTKATEMGFNYQGDVNIKNQNKPELNFEDSKLALGLSFQFPWQAWVNLSRKIVNQPDILKDPSTEPGFTQLLTLQDTGFNENISFDGGNNSFKTLFNSNLVIPKPENLPPLNWNTMAAMDAWAKALQMNIVEGFQKKGSFLLDLNVERFAKFSAFLEAMEPGSSANFAVLDPYIVKDAAKDARSTKIEFKEGKVSVNGQPNELLQSLVNDFLEKLKK